MQSMDKVHEIITNYQTIFLDIWGVLFDGKQLFPKALSFLSALEEKEICLISNTTSSVSKLQKRLKDLHIPPNKYHRLITAGSLLNQLLTEHQASGTYYYIGEEEKTGIIDVKYQRVTDMLQADFIIINGIVKTPLESNLNAASIRNIPAFCPNPDISFEDTHGNTRYCAGYVAKQYEKYGGKVHYIGKPYPTIYEKLIESLDVFHPNQTLVVGDSLNTDIKGAQAMGLDSLLVNTSYRPEKSSIQPTYVIENLTR
jgi:HAD superfamily hydrolase (TIGR01459 family)